MWDFKNIDVYDSVDWSFDEEPVNSIGHKQVLKIIRKTSNLVIGVTYTLNDLPELWLCIKVSHHPRGFEFTLRVF